MKLSTALNRENRGVAATVLVIIIFLEKADPRWDACVRETEYMRFYHMDFLKEIREDVVRSGVKGGVTLAGCGDCHRNRDQFCDRCHQAASVNLDCFGCHFYPETDAERISAGM
jgi:hypothetical protein